MCFFFCYFSLILGFIIFGIFLFILLKINCVNLWENFLIVICVCLFFYLYEEIIIIDMCFGKENFE